MKMKMYIHFLASHLWLCNEAILGIICYLISL